MVNSKKWMLPIPFKYAVLTAIILICIHLLEKFTVSTIMDWQGGFNAAFYIPQQLFDKFTWIILLFIIYKASHDYLLHIKEQKFYQHILQFFISITVSFVQILSSNALLTSTFVLFEGSEFNLLSGHSLSSILSGTFSGFIIYWVIASIFFSINYYKRFHEQKVKLVKMENDLNNAELSALKMQLNPHFLFNTLHTISSLMGKNDEGQKVLSRLGLLLRSMLEENQNHTVTLKDEINYIQSYLYIEEIRFQDRLKIFYEIAEDTEDFLVPNLILQPLVENAIKHGFSKQIDGGQIKITSKIKKDMLALSVEDDGKGASIEPMQILENPGIGIKNIHERLKHMYKENFQFIFESENGFTARILIPIQRTEQK
jgi:two-component system, LytTR family, sensor kinase